ncbi:alpha/beta hydrolase [Pandoraea terrae]|uniref:Alpha/beta hydrolase n=1 Tax=Pandoraea terrae TaxID=1537710 RepID=A0A5E4UQ61_9BURK|nr:alpha/beta hydrolase [Pandoraea terrae]VVE01169.1 alpha/beta hydrolase [Pandoraea terrae]
MSAPLPACRIEGEGPVTLVLLHGIGGNRNVWAAQFDTFVRAGYRVAAWDMPGYGQSAPIAPCTMATLAGALRRMLDALRAPRCVLIGHSMGGMVAQELMAADPAGIGAVVLCGTSPAFGRADGDFQRAFVQARTAPLDAGKTMREVAESIVPKMLGEMPPGTRARAAVIAVDAMAAVPQQAYRDALEALVGFDQRAALPRMDVPVLLVAGEHDTNAPAPVMAKMRDKLPDAEYLCLPGAGHLMNLSHAGAFDAAVLDFLSRRLA